ncbi:MAG: hypothetical protein ABIK09_01710 [Pseudomonadota bacterium]
MRIAPFLVLLLVLTACVGGGKDQDPAEDIVPAKADIPALDTTSEEDSSDPSLDTVIPPEDTVIPPEDTVIPPEDTVIPPEDTVIPPEDTVIPPEDTVIPPEDTPPADTPCVPACEDLDCGDDGCGGVCGTCDGSQDLCVDGLCVCQPACDGPDETLKECGPDGCGDVCGACSAPDTCDLESSLCACDCTGVAPAPVCDEATGVTYEHGCAAICSGVGIFVPGACSMECIIDEGLAIEVGDQVPEFSCPDLNPSSPFYGGLVTPAVLSEQVWIAYFGSCT